MNNFEFRNPTKLIFGKGQIASVAREIPQGAKVMMTYGGGSIKRNGIYDQAMEALRGFQVVEFGGIEPNPQYATLMRAVEIARSEKIDFVLAVGGGSVIDGTKFIVCAANYTGENPWDIVLTGGEISKDVVPLPFAAILTLPATASEMNNGAVISNKSEGTKFAFYNPLNYPQFSVLDPEAVYSLPDKQVANGLVDTFCHVMEQYLTDPTDSMIQDRFSEGILSTILDVAPKVMASRTDYNACANYMYAATMGLNGFASMGVPHDWATHMIGHELTALHGLDHGVTLAIVGPSLINVMRTEKSEKILQMGQRVFGITNGTSSERIDATIKAVRSFYESLGVKTHLSEYGIGDENFIKIAGRFQERKQNLGERGAITPEKVLEILKGAL